MVLGEIMREKYVIWGIGANGMNFIDIYGKENIVAIIDRNKSLRGQKQYLNIPIITFEEYINRYSTYAIIVTQMDYKGLLKILEEKNISNFKILRDSVLGWAPLDAALNGNFVSRLMLIQNQKYIMPKGFTYELITKALLEQGIDIVQSDDYDAMFSEKNLNRIFYERWSSRFEAIKEKKRGDSIFVIGNGPSLRVDDLEAIAECGIPSIGTNNIFYAFEKTNWRPDFFVLSDHESIREYASSERIQKIVTDIPKIISDNYYEFCCNCSDENTYFFQQLQSFPDVRYSGDITEGVYSSDTVTYAALQIASYLGYKNIYLLGVDNGGSTGEGKKYHFYEEKVGEVDINGFESTFFRANTGYSYADSYSKNNGFRIFNATRGGCLEAFQRVSFESVIGEFRNNKGEGKYAE